MIHEKSECDRNLKNTKEKCVRNRDAGINKFEGLSFDEKLNLLQSLINNEKKAKILVEGKVPNTKPERIDHKGVEDEIETKITTKRNGKILTNERIQIQENVTINKCVTSVETESRNICQDNIKIIEKRVTACNDIKNFGRNPTEG